MPIHDWTRVDAGLFHAFHQSWIVALCNALNRDRLPSEYFALPEQSIRGPIPDVLTLSLSSDAEPPHGGGAGVAVAAVPPCTHVVHRAEERIYVRKADRVVVRHRHGRIVAVIEVVSPGNKSSTSELRTFVERASDLLVQGAHLQVIDLFPPSKRDPRGIHGAIWEEFEVDQEFTPPPGKPLTLASYDAGPPTVAYVEPIAVADTLPDMPLFLQPEFYVPTPLDATYQTTWSFFPAPVKRLLEPPANHVSQA
jgi:hypothetical protein